jgi:hypothetical protein
LSRAYEPSELVTYYRITAMTDKESLTGIEQDVQIEERTKHAMENYFNWLQNTMSASPWTNADLKKNSSPMRRKTSRLLWDLYKNLVRRRIWKTW